MMVGNQAKGQGKMLKMKATEVDGVRKTPLENLDDRVLTVFILAW